MTVIIHRVVTGRQIEAVTLLAQRIWPEHFTAIIGADQLAYMLDKFESIDAINNQLASGGEYYLAESDHEPIGYTCIVPDKPNSRVLLNKRYVVKASRGAGVGKAMLQFIQQNCQDAGYECLWLRVNRGNLQTINWYQRQGFVVLSEDRKDIGKGFYMDDYIMQKALC